MTSAVNCVWPRRVSLEQCPFCFAEHAIAGWEPSKENFISRSGIQGFPLGRKHEDPIWQHRQRIPVRLRSRQLSGVDLNSSRNVDFESPEWHL